MREDLLGMVVRPSLSLPIDEMQIGAMATSRAAVFPGNNSLQEYINRACNTTCPHVPIIEKGARFLRQILLVDRA